MCYSLWYNVPKILPAGSLEASASGLPVGNIVGALYLQEHYTQSSAPEDGQNNFPKHAEMIGIINKPLLLHLVGCLYYLCDYIFLTETLTVGVSFTVNASSFLKERAAHLHVTLLTKLSVS